MLFLIFAEHTTLSKNKWKSVGVSLLCEVRATSSMQKFSWTWQIQMLSGIFPNKWIWSGLSLQNVEYHMVTVVLPASKGNVLLSMSRASTSFGCTLLSHSPFWWFYLFYLVLVMSHHYSRRNPEQLLLFQLKKSPFSLKTVLWISNSTLYFICQGQNNVVLFARWVGQRSHGSPNSFSECLRSFIGFVRR